MRGFASVQARVAEPFFTEAPMSLSKVERLAEDSGLPGRVISSPTGVIALNAAENFMVKLDRYVGEPLFLLKTLRCDASSDSNSVANIPMPRGTTGVEAITVIADRISSVLLGASFLCKRSSDKIWLLRTANTTQWTDYWPVQQYNLEVALQAVRRVFGPSIRPVSIRLNRKIDQSHLPDEMRSLPIELSNKTMGLAFDLSGLLGASNDLLIPTNKPRSSDMDQSDALSTETIGACIASFLATTNSKRLSQIVSKSYGMSERSYRRRLSEFGVTHKELVADARIAKADRMLRDPDHSITDIAFELGYSYPANFTRFFIDRVGMSPLQYRRNRSN
jgi:AraC-like DNA-binding protein